MLLSSKKCPKWGQTPIANRLPTWNGENRLIEVYDDTAGYKVEFVYDYMGRRVEKKSYTGTSGTSWTLSTHEKFVYDGYKLIEKLDGANSNAILQKFLWNGEEILSVYDVAATATYYYFADANKNIGQLMDASGNTVAKYEYSPFGRIYSATGAYAATNPFGFSSEYYDSETQLVYYNYRYYSPTLGRWLSRDPIAEKGGWNLYGMVKNNPINFVDDKGEFWIACIVTIIIVAVVVDTIVTVVKDAKKAAKKIKDGDMKEGLTDYVTDSIKNINPLPLENPLSPIIWEKATEPVRDEVRKELLRE